jgi:hypothetical protein
MITVLVREGSMVGNTVVQRRLTTIPSERLEHSTYTHSLSLNSTTVGNGEGTLRVESACRSFVETSWAPLMVGRLVR